MRHHGFVLLVSLGAWLVGCDDDEPARAQLHVVSASRGALDSQLFVTNEGYGKLKVPGELQVVTRKSGGDTCRWETMHAPAAGPYGSADFVITGECDAPDPSAGDVVEFTFTSDDGWTYSGQAELPEPDEDVPPVADEGAEGTGGEGSGAADVATPQLADGEITVTPYPLKLRASRIGTPDPRAPETVVVEGPSCTVHVAEVHPTPGSPVNGNTVRSDLGGVGAEFSRADIADDRWQLAYGMPSGGLSVHHGLVIEGHIYVCRGDYQTPQAQACGAATCETLHGTGGAAAPAPSGEFVAHCSHEALCSQAREEVRGSLPMTCRMVGASVEPGPCPATGPGGSARLGVCESRGMAYVYYESPTATTESARSQCDQLGGTFEAP